MLGIGLLFCVALAFLTEANAGKDHDPRLKTAVILNTPTTGASTRGTPEGRTFLKLARIDGTTGSQIVEVIGNNYALLPDRNDAWNSWNASTDSQVGSEVKYVSANAQRIGPDGRLWVVDSGALAQFPNSSKLISYNLTTNEVDRVYYLGNITTTEGSINDVRFKR